MSLRQREHNGIWLKFTLLLALISLTCISELLFLLLKPTFSEVNLVDTYFWIGVCVCASVRANDLSSLNPDLVKLANNCSKDNWIFKNNK